MRYANAKLKVLAPDDQIECKHQKKAKDLMDCDALQPTKADGFFCAQWMPTSPGAQGVGSNELTKYDCTVTNTSIPKNVYRISDILRTENSTTSQTPLLILKDVEGGQPIESGEILLLQVHGEATGEASSAYDTSFASQHPCARPQAEVEAAAPEADPHALLCKMHNDYFSNKSIATNAGGGACEKVTRVRSLALADKDGAAGYEYVAVLWKWKETYDNLKQLENKEVNFRISRLMEDLNKLFKGRPEVTLVIMDRPDGGNTFVPVFSNNAGELVKLHKALRAAAATDMDFEIDDHFFADGPDIFLGFCNCKPA